MSLLYAGVEGGEGFLLHVLALVWWLAGKGGLAHAPSPKPYAGMRLSSSNCGQKQPRNQRHSCMRCGRASPPSSEPTAARVFPMIVMLSSYGFVDWPR